MANQTPIPAIPQQEEYFMAEHLVPWLLARLIRSSRPWALTEQELERGVQHLNSCASCRTGMAVLAHTAAAPFVKSLRAHAESGDEPTAQDLAFYAAMVAQQGVLAADRHYSEIAAHVVTCIECSETVDDTVEMLGGVPPSRIMLPVATAGRIVGVVTDDIPTSPARIWQPVGTLRRLIDGYQIRVREFAVRISSALADSQIVTEFVGSAAAGWREHETQTRLEQSFTVDLCDEPAAPRPWVRAKVHLKALTPRRTSARIATRLVAGPDEEGEIAAGITWRLDHQTAAGGRIPRRRGTTDSEGEAAFYIQGFGDYVLTFEAGGLQWEVPLHLEPDQPVADPQQAQ